MILTFECDKKLRRVGILSTVTHGEETSLVQRYLEAVLVIFKLLPPNAFTARAVAMHEVPSLCDEVLYLLYRRAAASNILPAALQGTSVLPETPFASCLAPVRNATRVNIAEVG